MTNREADLFGEFRSAKERLLEGDMTHMQVLRCRQIMQVNMTPDQARRAQIMLVSDARFDLGRWSELCSEYGAYKREKRVNDTSIQRLLKTKGRLADPVDYSSNIIYWRDKLIEGVAVPVDGAPLQSFLESRYGVSRKGWAVFGNNEYSYAQICASVHSGAGSLCLILSVETGKTVEELQAIFCESVNHAAWHYSPESCERYFDGDRNVIRYNLFEFLRILGYLRPR